MDRFLVISSDCHAGLLPEAYRAYLDPQYRDAFDVALPIQIAAMNNASKRFLIDGINEEWRKGRDEALSGAWDHGQRIKVLLGQDGKLETHGLRLKVVGGGCSGLQYQLSFDDERKDIDSEFEVHGVKIVIDEKSALYLVGSRLDFVDTLQESGFKIENPNASNSCGCGQSFAA